MNIVGTPYRLVHRSSAQARSVASASNVSAGYTMQVPCEVAARLPEHHPEAVVERHRDADRSCSLYPSSSPDEVAVVEDVVVAERRALGEAGGAARVLDVDRIVEVELGHPARECVWIGRRARRARPTPRCRRRSRARAWARVRARRATISTKSEPFSSWAAKTQRQPGLGRARTRARVPGRRG